MTHASAGGTAKDGDMERKSLMKNSSRRAARTPFISRRPGHQPEATTSSREPLSTASAAGQNCRWTQGEALRQSRPVPPGRLGPIAFALILTGIAASLTSCASESEAPRETVTVWDPFKELGGTSVWSRTLESCAARAEADVVRVAFDPELPSLDLDGDLLGTSDPDVIVFPSWLLEGFAQKGILSSSLSREYAPADISKSLEASGVIANSRYAVPFLIRPARVTVGDPHHGGQTADGVLLALTVRQDPGDAPEVARCLLSPEPLAAIATEQNAIASTWSGQDLQAVNNQDLLPLIREAQLAKLTQSR
jgi:hypothetical protein